MNDRETRRYDAFGRTQTFCITHAADFADGSKCKVCLTNLGQIIADLDLAKAVQASGSPTAREVLLDALRLDLQNLTRTAAAIAQDEPGFADQFRPPDGPGQTAVLTTTDAFLVRLKAQPGDDAATSAAKAALVARFVAHELPATFVQDLADDRAAITAAQDAEESADNEGVESTAAIGRLIRAGMKEVTTLNAIMHNKYARNPDKLRAWQSASHVERAPQREKKPAPADAKSQAAGTASTPAAPAAPDAKAA